MVRIIDYLRTCFCKHDYSIKITEVTFGKCVNVKGKKVTFNKVVQMECKKCGFHKEYWKL